MLVNMQMKSCLIKIVCFFCERDRKDGEKLLIEEYGDVPDRIRSRYKIWGLKVVQGR